MVGWLVGWIATSNSAVAQQQLPLHGTYDPSLTVKAWVDPVHGNDNTAALNDPDRAFRRLQSGIDALHTQLKDLWNSNPIYREGVVIALPGVYGPNNTGPNDEKSSDDTLPIRMRDRVHVFGVGARRCILRGINVGTPHYVPSGSGFEAPSVEVLLDFTDAYFGAVSPPGQAQPPWFNANSPQLDVAEAFEGFTFQGGDIQVHVHTAINSQWESRGIVSNCVFDMRNNWAAPNGVLVPGPSFGVMMDKQFTNEPSIIDSGYIDSKLLVLGNTFIMAQWGIVNIATGSLGWVHSSLQDAVGIIDVTEPCCLQECGSQPERDCDIERRGVGNPGVINNLFRTRPGWNHMAMVGITLDDTRALDPVTGAAFQSNAFAPGRVGSGNPSPVYTSLPVESAIVFPYTSGFPALYDCVCSSGGSTGCSRSTTNFDCSATPNFCANSPGHPCPYDPASASGFSPAVAIFDGVAGVDPGFAGEYFSTTKLGLEDYVDWRLIPYHGSPVKDAGQYPIVLADGAQPPHINIENGTVFDLPPAFGFDWDGEGHGNPRIVNGLPDIGHDEIHLAVMAGSYGNHSNSHNQAGSLHPFAATGASTRFVILADQVGNDPLLGDHLKINGAILTPSASPVAWTIPPPALGVPVVDPNLPSDFQTKYISFNSGNPPPPTPWEVNPLGAIHQQSWSGSSTGPMQSFEFLEAAFVDQENDSTYFCTQSVIKEALGGTVKYRGNLQAEYR